MEKFIIQGLPQGGLHGEIAVKGAKNHALKVFAASILSKQPMTLTNVPEIEDLKRLIDILIAIGADVQHPANGEYVVSTRGITATDLPEDLVPKLRSSIVLTGPMLARFGKVSFPHPGGCAIGRRPIDHFIDGYVAMGAQHEERDGVHYLEVAGGLQGADIVFDTITVTGTETLMMAATLAKGTTRLINAAQEPEIVALAEYLNSQGANIQGAGTTEVTIEGVAELSAGIAEIIPDRIEALSFLALGLATKSTLKITHCNTAHLLMPLHILGEAGADLEVTATSITTKPWRKLEPITLTTREYPGFPTDGQSPFTVLLTQIEGTSNVHETIFSDRLFYTDVLNRMGANIQMHTPQHVSVTGLTPLRGKKVESPDLRAGIALVIAAAIAEGTTTIENIYQIDRGYEAIDERLRSIGLDIQRIDQGQRA